ncbi:hypothetical protein CPB84DRAFT_1751067 [Gymnopilus junonius]|uniref:Uncharacterized protein n=1 Tax=Gymnopilus junonius TaxID=109634 RepID=A0A9P5NDB8_GYMJU|nr:hypothetical protein CPB84DRAFT_1751067 [Gymnopilus junonius]
MPMSDSVLQTRVWGISHDATLHASTQTHTQQEGSDAVRSRAYVGGSGGSGDDGQAATSGLLFNARKVGLALSREHQWAKVRSPPCLMLIFPTEEGGKLAAAALGWVIEQGGQRWCQGKGISKSKEKETKSEPTSSLEGGARAVAEREEEESGGQSERERAGSMMDRPLISFGVCRSGIHVNLWVPVLAGHPSHREMHGVTWQRPMLLRPTQLAKGYPPTLLPSTPSPPSASSRICLQAHQWADRRRAHVVMWLLLLPLHMPPRHLIYAHTGVIDAILVISSTLSGMACDVIAASAALCSLANPEKALIILDQWVMQPGFAKGVLLVFPLSCCIVLKVFISVWGEEKGRSCCFASS